MQKIKIKATLVPKSYLTNPECRGGKNNFLNSNFKRSFVVKGWVEEGQKC